MTTKCTGLMGRIFGHKWVDCCRIRFLHPHVTVVRNATKKDPNEAREQWSQIDDCFNEWIECSRCGEVASIRQHSMDGERWTDYRQRCGAVKGEKK